MMFLVFLPGGASFDLILVVLELVVVLAPQQRLLVHRHGLLEELLAGVQHGEALVDAQSNVLQDFGGVVGLVVDVALFDMPNSNQFNIFQNLLVDIDIF